jgi:hypothetical protein
MKLSPLSLNSPSRSQLRLGTDDFKELLFAFNASLGCIKDGCTSHSAEQHSANINRDFSNLENVAKNSNDPEDKQRLLAVYAANADILQNNGIHEPVFPEVHTENDVSGDSFQKEKPTETRKSSPPPNPTPQVSYTPKATKTPKATPSPVKTPTQPTNDTAKNTATAVTQALKTEEASWFKLKPFLWVTGISSVLSAGVFWLNSKPKATVAHPKASVSSHPRLNTKPSEVKHSFKATA